MRYYRLIFHDPVQFHPTYHCQQEGVLALKSQVHVCVQPDGDKGKETRITRRKSTTLGQNRQKDRRSQAWNCLAVGSLHSLPGGGAATPAVRALRLATPPWSSKPT